MLCRIWIEAQDGHLLCGPLRIAPHSIQVVGDYGSSRICGPISRRNARTHPPHGVLPFANVLSIPAINTFSFRHFVGAGASVVARTPCLRYMTMFGFIDVSAKSIARALDAGTCVGTVPDGIAGQFLM